MAIGEYINETGLDGPTKILSPFISTEWFSEESCYRGGFVHNALYSYLLGIWQPSPPEEYAGYIISGKIWIDENVDKVLCTEKRMMDETHRYSGQSDLVCTLKYNSKPGVVDWKTSLAFSEVWAGQCASYWNLAKKNGYPDCDWAAAVRLRKDGRPALANFIQNLDLELQYFLNANAAYRRYKKKIK